MGVLLLALSIPAAIWTGFRVRREDALVWHSLAHAAAAGVVASGLAWVAGFGLVGLIFFPVGFVLGLADAYFKIAELLWFWS